MVLMKSLTICAVALGLLLPAVEAHPRIPKHQKVDYRYKASKNHKYKAPKFKIHKSNHH